MSASSKVGLARAFLLIAMVCFLLACIDRASDEESLPAEPGGHLGALLEGVDSDKDGVRDDLQRYIAVTYSDPGARSALSQLAKAAQASLVEAESADRSLKNAAAVTRAIECIFGLYPERVHAMKEGLYDRLLNTEERRRAYERYDRHLEGHAFPMGKPDEWARSCEEPR